MSKVVYDLNGSTLSAKKIVTYTIVKIARNTKLSSTKFYKTRTEARQVAERLNVRSPGHRVAKTILVHP